MIGQSRQYPETGINSLIILAEITSRAYVLWCPQSATVNQIDRPLTFPFFFKCLHKVLEREDYGRNVQKLYRTESG